MSTVNWERRMERRVALVLLAVVSAWALGSLALRDGPPPRRAEPALLSLSEGAPRPPQEPSEAAVGSLGHTGAETAPEAAPEAAPEDPVTVESLTVALRGAVAVGARAAPIRHCRSAPGGCEARLSAFASAMVASGTRHGIDPVLLAAVALRESGLNPAAEGTAVGEGGIMQLHPRGVGRHSRFVRDARFRARCLRREPGACQAEVVEIGAEHLAAWISRCGSESAGLGGYNRGRCGETVYVQRVGHAREKLRGLL